jgi:hypothetical protein
VLPRGGGCALTARGIFCNVRGMRYVFIAAVAAWWGLGCATVPPVVPAQAPVPVQDAEAWRLQLQYEEEHARAEELGWRLAAAEAAAEVQRLERAEVEQARQALSEELVRLEAERRTLEEHNAQLQAKQKELAEMHEQMADVWFESALSRARRHSPPPEPSAPESPAPEPSAPASPESEQGVSP